MKFNWHHSSLAVTDIDAATAFHRDAFGFRTVFEARGMSDDIAAIAGLPGLTCDLVQMAAPDSDHVLEFIAFRGAAGETVRPPDAPPRGHVAFLVDDLEAAIARVTELGARLLGEITRFEEGRAVYGVAPGGSVFELEEAEA